MNHPLVERLLSEFHYPEVTLENHDAFVARDGMNVLFFPGDVDTVKDATDVAVVLPELVRAFRGQLTPGVVTDVFGDGVKLRRQYGFTHFPSLVFVRSGEYVGTIMRIQDWGEYLQRIDLFFVAEAKRPPGFSIPVVSA